MLKTHINSVFLPVILLFVLTGCGGGSSPAGGSVDTQVTVSGTVQKGFFTTLHIKAFPVDSSSGLVGEAIPVKVNGQNFSTRIDSDQTLLLEAAGEFINDVTGEPVTLDQPLTVILDIADQDVDANINLLTTIVAERTLQQLPTSTQPVADLIVEQESFVNNVFGLPVATRSNQLDYANIQAASDVTNPDLALLLLSAGISGSLEGGQLFAGGFARIFDSVVNANTIVEAAANLDMLDGLAATVLYDRVVLNSGYGFLPALPLENSPVLSCIADTACTWQLPGWPTVSVYGSRVYEASGEARITVRLSEISTEAVEVHVSTVSDTATEGVDYIGINKILTIPAGESQIEVDFGLIIDALAEPVETISVVLESRTQAYPVLLSSAQVIVRDGAPPALENQNASNMAIRSITVPFLCTSVGDCGPLPSTALGLVEGRNTLLMPKIGLAAFCADSTNCPEQAQDWRVDFYLVAKDVQDARQAEIPLGSYIYPRASVALDSQTALFRYPFLAVGGTDVEDLVRNANNGGWQLEIEARLGSPAMTKTASLPSFTPLPSSILAGDTEIPLGTVFAVTAADQTGCGQGDISIFAQFLFAFDSSETGRLCIQLDAANPASTAVVVDGVIDLQNAIFDLPADVSARVVNQYVGYSILYPGVLKFIPVFLHAEGWPFELLLEKMTLSSAGLTINYKDMRYVMDVGYSDQDPRANGQLYSNDIFYRDVSGQSGTLILKSDGLQGSFNVAESAPGLANSAFPKAGIEWLAFTQTIEQNRLQPVQMNIARFTMQQATACSEPGCDGDLPQSWQVVASQAKLDGDGFVLADAINPPDQVVVFGAKANGEFAWSRPDDLTQQQNLKLALPGYVMPPNARVSDYLLAHLNETPERENLARYPLGSDAFVEGNYHPIGLSLGPEIYRNAQGIPEPGDGQNLSIFDNSLTINNGVDAPFSLASSIAVKYVLRNAGVTGVFNVAASSLGANSSAQFYGYSLNLSRFAVRATDNKLDRYTWIDGALTLNEQAGGPDGLDIWFNNLEINCAARLGNVDLIYEACDDIDNNDNNIVDENCTPQLFAWKSKTDIFAAGFSGAGGAQSCVTGAQNFTLDQQLFFKALNKPVAFQTQWDPQGFLVGQRSDALPTYRFDTSAEGKGFPIKTRDAKLGAGKLAGSGDEYGWLELTRTRLGVQFWDALQADVRVANQRQFAALVAEPTVVLPSSQLAVQQQAVANTETNTQLLQRTIDNNVDLSAQYQWGNTGFGFQLPVYYQPYQLDSGNNDIDAQGRQSRFIGRTLSRDLFVMDANAGINFIEPERTKLSFGASADFERLGNLGFQVDLSDPDSASSVDVLLMSLNITREPLLQPALTDFLDSVNVINRYASRGLDEVVQEGLELAVLKTGQATAALTPNNQDPFVTASEALALVRSGPQQAIAILVDEIRKPLDNKLFTLENMLRNEISSLEDAITQSLPRDQVLSRVDKVITLVDRTAEQASAVDGSIDDIVTRAQGLLLQALNTLNDLQSASQMIDQVLLQSVSFVESGCSAGLVPDAEGNGYLDKVAIRFAQVRKLADIIRSSNNMFAVAELLALDGEQKRRLNTSKRRIREAVGELLGFVAAAENAVRNTICTASNIDDVAAKAQLVTARISAEAFTAGDALTEAMTHLGKVSALHDTLSAAIINPVIKLSTALLMAREMVAHDEIPVDQLLEKTDCVLLELLSNGDQTCFAPPATPYGVNALIDEVFVTARGSINAVIDDAENTLVASLDNLLPGAYMTAQQMREMLVAEIMNSAPIKAMRTQMDKHFSEINHAVNGIALQYLDQLNLVIQNALSSVTGPVNDALAAASSVVREMPLKAAGMDGYATIAGHELERVHIGAKWSMRGADDDSATEFRAALDAESWSARNIGSDPNDSLATPTACAVADSSSLLDVKISAYGLPINILASDIELEKIYLGFTLEQNAGSGPPLIPVGIFGGINTMGQIGFTDATVIDPAFAAGLGLLQTYIGASAAATFSSLEADVAFLVGRVCPGNTALSDLDPDVAKFLPSMPPSGFTGAYLRGGATIPIIPGGCALNVGVSADFGSWLFVGQPTTLGGLIGGGAVGQVACIASIRGKVRVAGSVNTDGDLKLGGEAWGVAGVGFCEPGSWTSVRRSRDDSWCGTGDVQIDAGFENGEWNLSPPSVDAIF